MEDQNSFSFLDMKITRNTEEKASETSVYRKSTFSGVFTNLKSFIPMTYISCLSICSFYEKFHEAVVKLKGIFKRNSYPEKVIDTCIKNFLNKLHVPKIVDLTAAKESTAIH